MDLVRTQTNSLICSDQSTWMVKRHVDLQNHKYRDTSFNIRGIIPITMESSQLIWNIYLFFPSANQGWQWKIPITDGFPTATFFDYSFFRGHVWFPEPKGIQGISNDTLAKHQGVGGTKCTEEEMSCTSSSLLPSALVTRAMSWPWAIGKSWPSWIIDRFVHEKLGFYTDKWLMKSIWLKWRWKKLMKSMWLKWRCKCWMQSWILI